MPRRKKVLRNRSVSSHDIEMLRRAIAEGYPWILHQADNLYRHTGLTIQQNILLSYVTGIAAGVGVFLAGEDHPSKETVLAVRAELQADIDEAEERYKAVFTGERRHDKFFRHTNWNSPPRSEY
jgi:hypothetical protein